MLGALFDFVYSFFNPFPSWVINYLYPYIFVMNISLLAYYIFKNKKQVARLKKLIDFRTMIVVVVLIGAGINMLFCMNHL